MFLILLSLLVVSFSQTYQIEKFYSQDLTCSFQETSWLITQVTTCTPSTSCQNLNGNAGKQVTCQSTLPSLPTGWASLQSFQSSTNCGGIGMTFAAPADTCSGYWSGATVRLLCAPIQGSIVDCQASSATCGGCPSQQATKGGTCVQGNPTLSFTMSSYIFTCPSVTTTATTRASTTGTSSTSVTTTPGGNKTNAACGLIASFAIIVVVLYVLV